MALQAYLEGGMAPHADERICLCMCMKTRRRMEAREDERRAQQRFKGAQDVQSTCESRLICHRSESRHSAQGDLRCSSAGTWRPQDLLVSRWT